MCVLDQVVASLLAVGVILLAINTAVRRFMRGQRHPYVEQKRNTERIALTKSRFRAALSIDRSTRPAGARAVRGVSEGEAGLLPPNTVRERQGGGVQREAGVVAGGFAATYDANGVGVEESTTVSWAGEGWTTLPIYTPQHVGQSECTKHCSRGFAHTYGCTQQIIVIIIMIMMMTILWWRIISGYGC